MIKVGILGTGNIGTDLLLKVLRTDFLTPVIFSGRRMDSDGLAISFKGVRDGLAVAMGIDDGDERIEWQYDQQIGKEYSVSITIGA